TRWAAWRRRAPATPHRPKTPAGRTTVRCPAGSPSSPNRGSPSPSSGRPWTAARRRRTTRASRTPTATASSTEGSSGRAGLDEGQLDRHLEPAARRHLEAHPATRPLRGVADDVEAQAGGGAAADASPADRLGVLDARTVVPYHQHRPAVPGSGHLHRVRRAVRGVR